MIVDVNFFFLIYCSNILKLHDKCAMSSLRCLLFLYLLYIHYQNTTTDFVYEEKRKQKIIEFFSPSKSQFHSYAKKKIDFKSTINYLFCERALFLFAYTSLKKMFNPKLLNFRIKKMKRVVAEHVGRDKKKRGKKTRRKGQPLKSAFWLSIINILKRSENKEPTRT